MKQYKLPEGKKGGSPRNDSSLEKLIESSPPVQLLQTKVIRQADDTQVLYKDHLSYLLAQFNPYLESFKRSIDPLKLTQKPKTEDVR